MSLDLTIIFILIKLVQNQVISTEKEDIFANYDKCLFILENEMVLISNSINKSGDGDKLVNDMLMDDKLVNQKLNNQNLDNEGIKFIILVNSKPEDYKTRCGIRSSWSHHSKNLYHDLQPFIVLFQLGDSENYPIYKQFMENKIYGDMLIHTHIRESYFNLSYKNIESWKLINEKYKNADFIVKTDSDVFLNLQLFDKHLKLIKDEDVYYEGYM